MKNKTNWLGIIISLAFIFLIGFSSAESNYCCEKTLAGAWCQNDVQANCDSQFKIAPTSCDSTSYCKKGCCYDSQEGLCMESTSQKVCADSGGTWADDAQCDIPQCSLGCCVLGDQGAFVTLARCKSLAGLYGILTDFRKNIADEISCIAAAGGEQRGACVYEDTATFQKTCKFTTRNNCKQPSANVEDLTEGSVNKTATSGFYADVLCSAEELGTNCGPSTKTTLVDGKDEVYFTDTCGNIANIYDASRYDDDAYWNKVYKKEESCGYGGSNARSSGCGNCDYMAGSIGRKATGILGKPTYGDYICIDLSCKKEGKKHGESWCETDSPKGEGKDTAGSRYYREICLFGEVITEPCADFRNEICISGKFNGFSEAACRVNRWQDCSKQVEQDDCENSGQRDCYWKSGYYLSSQSGQIEKSTEDIDKDGVKNDPTIQGICLPNVPPGFNFWGESEIKTPTAFSKTTNSSPLGTGYVSTSNTGGTTGSEMCSLGNAKITFKWEKVTKLWPLTGEDWACAEGEEGDSCRRYIKDPTKATLTSAEAKAWAKDMNEMCFRLGDCGGYSNFVGKSTTDGYAAYKDNKRIAGAGGAEVLETASTSSTSGATQSAQTAGAKTGTTGGLPIQGKVIVDYIKEIVNGE